MINNFLINRTANVALVGIVLMIMVMYCKVGAYEVVYVKSGVNGKEYLVRNLPNKQNAADLLANLSINLENLVNYLSEQTNKNKLDDLYDKYVDDDDKKVINKKKFKDDIKRVINNFNADEFSESTPDAQYTSYSINKGEKIVFCLRSRDEEENMVKKNVMMFVALHELSHLMTKSVGHKPEFWNNFKILLKIAINLNIYKHIDFNRKPVEYCGTKITDTPYKI
jgi:hypothetical protein